MTVLWDHPGDTANYNATSTDEYVWINGDTLYPASDGWAETVVHELVHVIDRQLLDDTARGHVLAVLTREGGLPPVWGLDGSVPYPQRAGEAFAETVARHLWYGLAQGAGASADLGVWGAYSWDNATALPVMLDTLKETP